jgi:predicted N-acetyltransferase YhbS
MSTTHLPPTYIADADVDESLDRELRELLSQNFTGAEDTVFKHRRYFNEPAAHRWIVRGTDGVLAAHLAVHDKAFQLDHETLPFGGIAEVCVRPEFRGQKLVKHLLAEAHVWLTAQKVPFASLFGDPQYYGSSGYIPVTNVCHEVADEQGRIQRKPAAHFLVASLSPRPWPTGEIFLPGKPF